MNRHYFLLYKFHRIALLLHLWILILKLCSGLDLDKLPPQTEYKSCTKDADCENNECCTFEAKATLTSSTKIVWRCKPLGNVNEMCHSLGSVHCPCRAGLRCAPKAIWYFGAGLCKEKM